MRRNVTLHDFGPISPYPQKCRGGSIPGNNSQMQKKLPKSLFYIQFMEIQNKPAMEILE